MRKDPRESRKWLALSKLVRARDGYICAYCGEPATSTDHIIPVTAQPELAFSLDNLVACCRRCNSRKSNRSQAAFLGTLFAPPVFSNCISPETAVQVVQGPCMGQPSQDLT